MKLRKFTIIGGGQSGLMVAIGLLKAGHQVRVVQNRTAEQLRDGRVLSSQCMFGWAVQNERDLGIEFWEDECPPVEGIAFAIPDGQGGKAIDWAARLDRPGYAVDQRIKMPRWLAEFEKLGGQLVIADAGIAEIDRYAAQDDLVIVASGKGEVGQMFARDPEKSPYDKPMRALALTYVKGVTPREPFSAVEFNIMPGVGEFFMFPSLTTTGPCEIMVFEGIPGGPMDCWADAKTPAQHLERSLEILRERLPWEYERCKDAQLTDDNGILAGRFAPTIRKPVATLPSGRKVLGLGDAVCLNDPITGQGSNNASKAAAMYLGSILAHGDRPYDEAFMQATFDRFWDYARWVVQWTNSMLVPPKDHVVQLLGAAQAIPPLASRISNGFSDPRDFFPWWVDADAAGAVVAEMKAAA